MNETKKRIAEYKKKLPKLKEKVLATALLVILAFAMATTSTFAWLVLSRAPEVTGATTALAANGNLEIALVGPNGAEPAESKIGDGSSQKSIAERNLTWGNLVNLSDPVYGLDELVLRPAQLNETSLLTNPLNAAVYDEDGRVIGFTSDFGYTKWTPPSGAVEGYFGISNEYGVRAISSTTMQAVGANATYHELLKKAKDSHSAAKNAYATLAKNNNYMNSLATMMGLHMTARMNTQAEAPTYYDPVVDPNDIKNFLDLYGDFLKAFELEAQAMADMLNVKLFLIANLKKYAGASAGNITYVEFTADDVLTMSITEIENKIAEYIQVSTEKQKYIDNFENNPSITNLSDFTADHKKLIEGIEDIEEVLAPGGEIKWRTSRSTTRSRSMLDIVNNFVDVNTCTVGGMLVSDIGARNAAKFISGTHDAVITNGVLFNFEQRTGQNILVEKLTVKASIKRGSLDLENQKISVNVFTSAKGLEVYFDKDLSQAQAFNNEEFGGGKEVAKDTYGLAIDFWIRTNALNSHLVLGGNVLTTTETRTVTVVGKDGQSHEVYILTISGTDENGEEYSYTEDIYSIEETVDGTTQTKWYNANTHGEYTGSTEGAVKKTEEVVIVNGYEGDNRVWDGSTSSLISADASTQGSGSCYVFYYDAPEERDRILKLLASMMIAFVDDEGTNLATAQMDTTLYYEDNGRVIVPLKLREDSTLIVNSEGKEEYAITALEQNKATRITAIVYLDGTDLTNEDVLSASDIQGQLNIQFASSTLLKPIKDEALEQEIISVSASVDKTLFDFDKDTNFDVTVTAMIEGMKPAEVKAFFVRAINSFQASREADMTFIQDDSGAWTANYSFTAPGVYILRSLQIDGIEYELKDRPTVTVEGFAVENIGWGETEAYSKILSAAPSYSTTVSVRFASHDTKKMPTDVRMVFVDEETGNVASSTLVYKNPTWAGNVTFLTSGTYVLKYLVLNGNYTEIDEDYQKTADVTLGMRVAVYSKDINTFKYVPSDMEANGTDKLDMQVKIFDDAGNEIRFLDGARLEYPVSDSSVTKMEAGLTFNAETNYYEGVFNAVEAGPGVYSFAKVTVGENQLTHATVSPVFTIMPPEPPSYVKTTDFESKTGAYEYTYIFNTSSNTTLTMQLNYTQAARVWAVFTNTNGTVDKVEGKRTGTIDITSSWNFVVPNNPATGKQDGKWAVTELLIDNVYDEDGNHYTYDPTNEAESNPFVIDLTSKYVSIETASTIDIVYEDNKSQNFGKDSNGNVTASFMTSHTLKDLSVKLTDYSGKPVTGSSITVKLVISYVDGSSVTHGGYTSNSLNSAATGATHTILLTDTDGKGIYTQGADVTMLYAGAYTTTLTVDLSHTSLIDYEETYTYGDKNNRTNAPVFTVSSVAPTATITAAQYANKDGGASTITNGNTTTVYYLETIEPAPCGGLEYKNYTPASVTITLSGYGNASSAKLEFATSNSDGKVHLYEESQKDDGTSTNSYTWTGDGTCKRYMGWWESVTGTDRKAAAGTLKATNLVLVYGGNEYVVPVTITIENPS